MDLPQPAAAASPPDPAGTDPVKDESEVITPDLTPSKDEPAFMSPDSEAAKDTPVESKTDAGPNPDVKGDDVDHKEHTETENKAVTKPKTEDVSIADEETKTVAESKAVLDAKSDNGATIDADAKVETNSKTESDKPIETAEKVDSPPAAKPAAEPELKLPDVRDAEPAKPAPPVHVEKVPEHVSGVGPALPPNEVIKPTEPKPETLTSTASVPPLPDLNSPSQVDYITKDPSVQNMVIPAPLPAVNKGRAKTFGLVMVMIIVVGGILSGAYFLLMNAGVPAANTDRQTTASESDNTSDSAKPSSNQSDSDADSSPDENLSSPERPSATDSATLAEAEEDDEERMTDIKAMFAQIEAFYAQNGFYPILEHLNDAGWRTNNLFDLEEKHLIDPESTSPLLSAEPAAKIYSYQPSGPNSVACDNDGTFCTTYTLQAQLSDGSTYAKTNLN